MRVGKLGLNHTTLLTSRTKLDSHADVSVVGHNALILTDFERPVTVVGYDPTSKPLENVRTVGAALAYDHPETGQTIILTIHQALHIPTLSNNLLCPMQCRVHGVTVNDIPKFLKKQPSNDDHVIIVDDATNGPTRIPLSLHGIVSYFPTRKPTRREYETCERHYTLTSKTPEWIPSSKSFEAQESSLTDSRGQFQGTLQEKHQKEKEKLLRICQLQLATNTYLPTESDLSSALRSRSQSRALASFSTSPQQRISLEALARRWGISIPQAQQTLKSTTQRGVRTVLHPTLSRRFRTND